MQSAQRSERDEGLTAASLVCRARLEAAALSHVTRSISAFADPLESVWTLESLSHEGPKKFCEQSCVRLLDRLLAQESAGFSEFYRLKRYDHAVNLAATDSNWLVLDWWLTKYLPLTEQNVSRIMVIAAKNKRIHVLEWLEQEGVLPTTNNRMECGQPESAYWLLERGFSLSIDVGVAILEGNLEFLKWCYENRELHEIHGLARGIVLASSINSVEIAQWLVDTYPDVEWEEPDSFRSFKRELKMIQWLETEFAWNEETEDIGESGWETNGCTHKRWVNYSIKLAASGGQRDIVQYLYTHRHHEPKCQMIFDAAREGHMEVVQWLYQQGLQCSECIISYAAQGGQVEIVKWVHGQSKTLEPTKSSWRPCTYKHSTWGSIDQAALFGSMELVQWLHANRPSECSTEAMNNAAWIGDIDMVQWLHMNRSEGCTAEALRRAVAKGHFPIVQWLLEHRPECSQSISTSIMDLAAEYGHLEIMMWLYENRSDGCSTNAIAKAAAGGHFEVVKFLVQNEVEGDISSAINEAAMMGHLEIIKFLFECSSSVGGTTTAVNNAARHGHFDTVLWFYRNRRQDITQETISEATKYGHVQIVRFLHDHCGLVYTDAALAMAGRRNHFAMLEWATTRI